MPPASILQTATAPPRTPQRTSQPRVAPLPRVNALSLALIFVAITMAAILLHGYHPYVVDASIYVSGIEKSITPALYLKDDAFVAEHVRVSAFSLVMGKLQVASRMPLEWLLLVVYSALLFFFLLASYQLGRRMAGGRGAGGEEAAGWGSALLMTACLPIPVAATALLLVDPYLTARSFSTTLSLLAILACVDDRPRLTLAWCLLTAIFHPQMGVYLAAFLLTYGLIRRRQWKLLGGACLLVFAVCAAITFFSRGTPSTPSYREAVLSRDFYFPGVWHWYELVGLAAPTLLMGWTAVKAGLHTLLGRLAATSALVGLTSCVCCFCFVRTAGPYFLARLQLLRSFHTIYALGIVMLGSALATRLGDGSEGGAWRRRSLALTALTGVAAGMFLMQRQNYRTLPDVEVPGAGARSAWEQGFIWIRSNTPKDAFFAMDPRLLAQEDEATPGFRAVAQRSILTDVKDEGVASLFPALAPAWERNRQEEELLENLEDPQRLRQLQSVGVGWVLLSHATASRFHCPYQNAVMKVCLLASR